MKKSLYVAGGVVGGLVLVVAAAALVAPMLFDVNKYKPQIVSEVKKATGRDLAIDGPIRLSILPSPRVSAVGVRLSNIQGARAPSMVELREAEVLVALMPLLSGRVQVTNVRLIEPVVSLERLADGRANWEFPKPESGVPVPAKDVGTATAPQVGVDKLTIVNGRIAFIDAASRRADTLERVELSASAPGPDGPFAVSGSLIVGTIPFAVDAKVGTKSAGGHPVDATVSGGSGEVRLNGSLSELGAAAAYKGTLRVKADNLAAFLSALAQAAQAGPVDLPASLAQRAALDSQLEASPQAVALRDLKIDLGAEKLTGGLAVALQPTLKGDFALAGPKLRSVLEWAKVDVAGVPADKLQAFSLKGQISQGANNAIQIAGIEAKVDQTTARGGVSIATAPRLAVGADVEIDQIDVDAYQGKRQPTGSGAAPAPAAAPRPAAGQPGALPDMRVKARVARIVYSGERIEGVNVDVSVQGGRLTIADARIASLAGANVAVRGSVANVTSAPNLDLTLNLQTQDAERLLRLAGQQSPLGGRKLGPLTLSGGFAGTTDNIALRDFGVNALGATVRLTGRIALAGGAVRYELSQATFQTADADALVAALTGQPKKAGAIGAVSVKGSLAGDQTKANFRGEATAKSISFDGAIAASMPANAIPTVVIDGRTGPIDIQRLSGAPAPGGGAAAAGGGGGGYSRDPIDLSGLKSVNATVALKIPSIVSAPHRVENASLDAKLQGGVLTISRLNGQLHGGALDVSGTLDGSKAPGAYAFKVAATRIDLGQVTRAMQVNTKWASTSGVLTSNLNVSGTMASMQDVMSSMDGGGDLNGVVRVSVSREGLALAQTLGGLAAGGARSADKGLDRLTGGLISKSGVAASGASGELGDLASLLEIVSQRYANRDAPLSGGFSIKDGVVTLQNVKLQGSRSQATTTGLVRLGVSNIETQTDFYNDEDPSKSYVYVRMRGPFDAIKYTFDRPAGTARPAGAAQPAGQQPTGQQPAGQQPAGQPPAQQQRTPAQDLNRTLKKIF